MRPNSWPRRLQTTSRPPNKSAMQGWSAYALAGLAARHVAAALKHQWVDRDGLLQRTLPGRTAVTLAAKSEGGKPKFNPYPRMTFP